VYSIPTKYGNVEETKSGINATFFRRAELKIPFSNLRKNGA
jgi:hypothetical protein